jgi:transcriptional regulator with XRE-family HTH domain
VDDELRSRIREAIRRSGKKHSFVAEDAGITPATLSRVLSGINAEPRFDTVVKIMRAVGENVGWLLGEQGFGLSSDERTKIQTAAVILIDLTRGDNERLTSIRAIASRSGRRRYGARTRNNPP